MNVERTMEFILEQRAATAAQIAQFGEHLKKVDVRLDRLAERQEKTDRQLQAMKFLIKAGMKIMARNEERFRETDDRIRALTAAQERSDRRLDRLIQSWQGRSGSGKSR